MRPTGGILTCAFAAMLALSTGCGGTGEYGADRAEERDAPGLRQEQTAPTDLRTGEGNVGGTRDSGRQTGVEGEQGPPEEGGAGTAMQSGEIIGNQPKPQKEAGKKPQQR